MKKRLLAEWEPALGALVTWPAALLRDLALDEHLWVLVADGDVREQAAAWFAEQGVPAERVTFVVVPQGDDAVWVRDWAPHPVVDESGQLWCVGPRYVYSTPSAAGSPAAGALRRDRGRVPGAPADPLGPSVRDPARGHGREPQRRAGRVRELRGHQLGGLRAVLRHPGGPGGAGAAERRPARYTVRGYELTVAQEPHAVANPSRSGPTGWADADVLHCRVRGVWDPAAVQLSVRRPGADDAGLVRVQATGQGGTAVESVALVCRGTDGGEPARTPCTPTALGDEYVAHLPEDGSGVVGWAVEVLTGDGRTQRWPRPGGAWLEAPAR